MSTAAETGTESAATGMALLVVAMLIVPGLDIVAKLLMERLSPGQVGAGRFLVQTALLLPILLIAGQAGPPRRGHLFAGLFLAGALLTINLAIREMPVANAIAIFFVEPLILTVLAVPVLGERIGWRRLAAVAVGLAGAMVVLRPNLAAYGWSAAWPLATAVCFACYMLTTKAMTRTGGRIALQFWTGATAAAVLTFATLAVHLGEPGSGALRMPAGREWALFLLLGALAAGAHQLMVIALSRLDAGIAAPFQYLEIVSGTLLGWAVFGDFPDALTWAGTAIIVAAGLYVFRREARMSRRAALPAEPPGR